MHSTSKPTLLKLFFHPCWSVLNLEHSFFLIKIMSFSEIWGGGNPVAQILLKILRIEEVD